MAKQPFKYRRKLAEKTIPEEYPVDLRPPDELCADDTIRYVGSAEHKRYPSSFAGAPAHRESDATPCPPEWGKDEEARESFESSLRCAIRAECVGEASENGFPRYIWGFFEEQLCVARLINREQGWYKGWCLEEFERPRDPAGKLDTLQQETDAC